MIKSIQLQNFQSHRKSLLEFSPGVNIIIGDTNSGKTSILRGLNWLIYNRPSFGSLISHWNRNDNDEPIKSTFVRVITDKGKIERRKGKVNKNDNPTKFNGYIIDDDKYLDAIGTSVPDEINSILNISDINIQGQMDAPFLLSNTAGEIARFFNSIIKLDLIDRILSNADSKKREVNKDISSIKFELEKVNIDIDKINWVDSANDIIGKIEKIEKRKSLDSEQESDISNFIRRYKEQKDIIENSEKILSAIPLINKIVFIQESLSLLIEKNERLQNLYDQWIEQNKIINGMADFSNAKIIVDKIDLILESSRIIENDIAKLDSDIQLHTAKFLDKEALSMIIVNLTKSLPDKCPLCGAVNA